MSQNEITVVLDDIPVLAIQVLDIGDIAVSVDTSDMRRSGPSTFYGVVQRIFNFNSVIFGTSSGTIGEYGSGTYGDGTYG